MIRTVKARPGKTLVVLGRRVTDEASTFPDSALLRRHVARGRLIEVKTENGENS